MKNPAKPRLSACLFALAAAGVLTLLAGLGVLDRADLTASDALYQTSSATDGKIVIIGIDQKALESYGPYQEWCREGIARTLDILNADPDSRPAVIGIDVLFSGETDPQADEALSQAAGRGGNVVTACAAEFSGGLVETEDGFARSNFLLTAFEEPYPALKNAAGRGHINTMLDDDGVLRHHLLYFDLQDGTRVPSLALAERYLEDLELPSVNTRGFWYLPYSKTPGNFEVRSIADVLEGRIKATPLKNPPQLKGKAAGFEILTLDAIAPEGEDVR